MLKLKLKFNIMNENLLLFVKVNVPLKETLEILLKLESLLMFINIFN